MEVSQLISAPRIVQPSPQAPNTNVSHTWGYVSVEPDHRAGEVPSHLPRPVGQQDVGYTKPPLLRPLPNFAEHFRITGEFSRQFLEKLPSEVKTGRLPLENRRGFQSAIEAACFLKGRMIASNAQDAQCDVDQRLLHATWDILESHMLKINSSYPKRTAMHQLRAFLLGSQQVGGVMEDPNNVLVVADQSAGSAKPTKNPKDGGHDYAGYTQSAFDAYEGPPQIYPIQFQQNVDDMSFIPVQNTDIGPYVYPVTYPPLQSGYHDQNIQPGFALQTYGATALGQPIFQTLDPLLQDVALPSVLLQTPVQEVQDLDIGTAPGLSHGTKRGLDSSFQADQGLSVSKHALQSVIDSPCPLQKTWRPWQKLLGRGGPTMILWMSHHQPSRILRAGGQKSQTNKNWVGMQATPVEYQRQHHGNRESFSDEYYGYASHGGEADRALVAHFGSFGNASSFSERFGVGSVLL